MKFSFSNFLDHLSKIKDLAEPLLEPDSSTDDSKILERSINELSKFYSHLSNIYDQLRLKALALIAGEVTIVTFLFNDPTSRHVPKAPDTKIFYYSALIFLILTFGLLLWIISTVNWTLPHDTKRSSEVLADRNRNTYLGFLKYLQDDYCEVCDKTNKLVSSKCKRFNWCIYLLSAGAIILMVIKFAGGLTG